MSVFSVRPHHHHHRMLRLTAAAAALGLSLALGACAADDPMPGMPGMGDTAAPSSSTSTGAVFNDADVTFAQMMIPHHQQAVQMSDLILAKSGTDAEVTTLAQQIKAAQAPEITTMTGWLTDWGRPTDDGMGGMDHGGDTGMMTGEDMQQLETADGPAGQKLYLEGMIKHHQGAVAMAQDEIDAGKYADAIKLAQDIVRSQNAEIEQMTTILDRL